MSIIALRDLNVEIENFRMKKFELFAQCDGQICKALFAERSPNVEAMVDLLPDDQYQELRGSQRFLRTMHQLLKRAYKDANEQGLAYEPDNYGGYDLVYRGSDVIKSGNKVGGAMGYLQKVPHDFERVIKPISFIGPTKYCNFTRIMAGPIRFANHSCAPNCVYEASEINTRKAVVLRAKQDLKPGDILTVHYCDRFFGAGNSDCLCPHTELHGTSDHMEETGSSVAQAIPTQSSSSGSILGQSGKASTWRPRDSSIGPQTTCVCVWTTSVLETNFPTMWTLARPTPSFGWPSRVFGEGKCQSGLRFPSSPSGR